MELVNIFRKKQTHKYARIILAASYRDCFGGQYVRELYTLYNTEYKAYDLEPKIATYLYNNEANAKSYFDTLRYEIRNQHSDTQVANLLALYSQYIKKFNNMYPSDITQKIR